MPLVTGSRLGVYAILDPLGTGGMGEVYRALDTRLGREVAVKALPVEFSRDPARLSRFQREARMLAALNHPAVAAIYGLEDLEGTSFIVMELVPGQTLSEMLSRGALPLEESLKIARQIAEGLEAAHESGIVHRDLKPANIKVTPDGRVKVLDLGLAKALDTKETAFESDPTLPPTFVVEGTQPGVVLGTADFMSPEQARGKSVDKRTDIWAFGCVLYEMLSGRRAFTGETVSDVLAAILTQDPDWNALPGDTPPRIRELLGRCLQKDPARRLRDVGDARIEIEETLAQIVSSPAGRGISGPISQPVAAPAPPPESVRPGRRALTIAGAILVAGAVVGIWSVLRQSPKLPERMYLAVLPFKDLSGQPGGQLIGDSLVETVSVRLSGVPEIQVVTPTASIGAYDRGTEIHRIAKDLGANLLLRGTYQRQGDVVRITYSVLNTRDRVQVAAGSLDGPASDLFAIQDRLADRVAGALRLPTAPRRTPSPSGLETAGEQDRYLRAIGALQRYDKAARIDEAIRLLEPLAADRPGSALVHAALGRAYLYRFTLTRDQRWVALASSAVARARELLPNSPEVDVTFGELSLRTGKAADAVAAYRRALAAQPNHFDALLGLARSYDAAGDARLAEQNYKRAIELQPAYFGGYSKLAGFYYNHGRWAPAAEMFRKVTELAPDNAHAFANLGACDFALGRFDEALANFQRSLALEPTDLAWGNVGATQYYRGRYSESAAAFEKAVSLVPSDYANWSNLGDALRLIPGSGAKATQAYEKGIALARSELATNPNDAAIHSSLALCLAKTGRAAEAHEHLRISLALEPDRPQLLFNAAVVANRAKRPAEAVAYLSRAVRAGFSAAVIRQEPELANLRNRDDFDDVVKGHRRESSR